MPAHKSLHRCIFGKAEFIVQLCSSPVAVFGTLPELPAVCTLEHHAVFLALVFENTIAFFQYLAGAQKKFRYRNTGILSLTIIIVYHRLKLRLIFC